MLILTEIQIEKIEYLFNIETFINQLLRQIISLTEILLAVFR